MFRVEFSVKLPFKVKKKGDLYISSCNVLDVLKQCGFQARKVTLKSLKPIKDHGFITVPIPFNAKGACLSECRV